MHFRTTFGFGLACVLILIAVVSSSISISDLITENRWHVHAMEIRMQIERLSSRYMTAQNNLRAYHVTGQDYYLTNYSAALSELKKITARLREIVSEPAQKRRLSRVTHQLETKYEAWERSFETRRQSGFAAIQKLMMNTDANELDTSLFKAVNDFKAGQDRLLATRIEHAESQGLRTKWIVWLGGALACLLILAASYVVHRDNRRRQYAEDEMDRFFTVSLDLLCVADMDGYFKRLSPSYEDVLGYSVEELYSRPIVDFIHPDDVASTNAEIASQQKGNKTLSFENRFRHRNGTYRTLSWKSVPAGDFMYAVARDVTAQKLFESEILSAREEAQKATMAKSEFLANMSHEIRTPLNGVVGMADLLTKTELSEKQRHFVSIIHASSKSLLRIVNEILDFSKIEAGHAKLHTSDFSLLDLISSQISLAGILARERGLQIETEIDTALPETLHGDSGKMGQVLLNLLSNAIKFTEAGCILVSVNVKSRTEDSCVVRLAVKDGGIGISKDMIETVFDPFVQADTTSTRKYQGTGLGLSICRRLVHMMGGEIGVESDPGQGAEFWFELDLPIVTTSAPTLSEPLATLSMSPEHKARRSQIRVLVAEDNRINQKIAMAMLESLGYSTDLAQNGEEAVRKFVTEPYDIVLMDQHMPIMDGLSACREIRRHELLSGNQPVPIIAFTATVIQETQKAQFQSLMDDFIVKPVTLESLEGTLARWEERILDRA